MIMMDSPIVMFSDVNVEQIVSFWLDINIDFVNSYLGMILSKIGFSGKDKIYIYGYTKDSYLLFMVNDNEEHKILMSSKRVGDKYNPVVYYDKGVIEDGYECRIDKYGRFDIDFMRIKYDDMDVERLIDDDDEYEDIDVRNGGYTIQFRISKVGNGLYNKSKIISYLNSIKLPMSIFDIYKGIKEISFLGDESCFSLIDLRLINNDNEIEEMIVVSDGKLVYLLVNSNGKIISCSNMDNWFYETDLVLVDFSVTRNNGIIDFSSKVRLKEENKYYDVELASYDVELAKEEITNVKSLVRKVFKK